MRVRYFQLKVSCLHIIVPQGPKRQYVMEMKNISYVNLATLKKIIATK